MVEKYPQEFDKMKQGVYGLVSQEICNRIVRGELKPRNNLERAYFFYYLNKLTFGGDVKKVGSGAHYGGVTTGGKTSLCLDNIEKTKEEHAHWCGIMRPTDPCRNPQIERIKNEFETKGYCGIARQGFTGDIRKESIDKAKENYKENTEKWKMKGFGGMINPRAGLPTLHKEEIENIKDEFKTKGYFGVSKGTNVSDKTIKEVKEEWKTKGYHGLIDQKLQNARIDENGVEEAKATYRGIVPKQGIKANFGGPFISGSGRTGNSPGRTSGICKAKERYENTQKQLKKEFNDTVEERKKKVSYSILNAGMGSRGGMGHKGAVDQAKASYKGIANHGATGWGTLESGEVKKAKQQYQAVSYKGINPKTTRPYHNNDCGLLTPLDQKAIKRLRYVNLTCYDFKKVYKLFYNAFHIRKGLSRECFIYADPPYPGTEKYFGDKFPIENHQHLIDLMLETPFNFMLSIGGKCEMYLEQLSDWVIVPVLVRYSTDATSQKKSQEYIIMNYQINDIGNMRMDNQANIMRYMK